MASHSSSGSSFEPIADNQSIDLSRKSIEEAIEDDLSFVLAEHIDDDKTSGEEMSQSKYSQVVFLEIADDQTYPNDADIPCMFTYNFGTPLSSSTSDRIGLYKVPNFQPHEYVAFRWVHEAKQNGKDVHFLVFNACNVPKEEDFYQFQYLRTENGNEEAIGASIPFQIQVPKNDELCTVEDDEEFMVVRSKIGIMSEQMTGQLCNISSENNDLKQKIKELEQKHKNLLETAEKVQADLKKKSEHCKYIEEELKNAKENATKADQLKVDLATVLQDKLVLEEKLHRFQKAIQTLQTDRDLLAGERDQAIRERELLLKERDQVVGKNDEFKNMLNAATKAKELAVNELKVHILNKDEQQKALHVLHKRVEELEGLNQELVIVNKDLIATKDVESTKLKEELEAIKPEMENLRHQLGIKTNEFDLLRQEMVERSKSKFNEIDALKKQLAEAERNLAKYVEGQSLLNDTTSSISEVDRESIGGRLEQIERMVRETRSEMKEYMSKSMIVSTTSSEAAPSTTSTMSSNDSRHMLDDRVIHRHLVLSQPDSDDIPTAEASSSVTRETSPLKKKFNQVIEGFKQIEDAPQTNRVDQKINFSQLDRPCSRSSSSTPEMREMSPTIIENSIRNPLQRAQDTLSQFLPQLPGFSQSAPVKIVEEYHDRATTPIREQPRGEMPEPLVPEIVNSPIRLEQEVVSSDFSDLVNWARGNIASCNASLEPENVVEQIHSNIVFTDDGRTLTREESRMESRLKCPICEETFDEDDVRELEIHVDHHLATSLICPVCNLSFGMSNREAFERHVQEHFDNEEDTRGDFSSTRGNWSFLDFE